MKIAGMATATTTTSSSVLSMMLVFLCAAAAAGLLADAAHWDGAKANTIAMAKKPKNNTVDATLVLTGDLLVTEVCMGLRGFDWSPHLTQYFCESMLRSDKQSAAAKKPRDLALVATDLLQSAVDFVGARVDGELLSGRHDGKSAALTLRSCRLGYADLNRTIPVCRALIHKLDKLDPNNIKTDDYFGCAARLGNAASDCWGNVLDDEELTKLVSMEVAEVLGRASLVRAILEKELRSVDCRND